MFCGTYPGKIEKKWRVRIPSPFREKVGETLFLQEEGGTVNAYLSVKDFKEEDLPSVFEVKIDRQGRFILPKFFRSSFKTKNIIFLGYGKCFKII